VEDLRAALRRALRSWDAEAVHDARVATRRLKAAIDLLRPLLAARSAEAFAKALRRIRRTLGPLRDVDVMMRHLEAMRESGPGGGGGATAEWLSRRLRERRAQLRRRAARGPSLRKLLAGLGAWVDLEPEVRDSCHAAALLLRRVAPGQMRSFAQRADRLATRHRDAGGEAPPRRDAGDDLHELRTDGKVLRYTLELARPLGFELPKPVTRQLKALQDALGLWHDYTVLTDEMLRLALQAQLGLHDPLKHGQVLKLARANWEKAQRHLHNFFKLWQQRGAELADRVEAVFGDGDGIAPGANSRAGGNGAARRGRPPRVASTDFS
jgi:CHAD domain-containing protein